MISTTVGRKNHEGNKAVVIQEGIEVVFQKCEGNVFTKKQGGCMREKLGILVVEDERGQVGIQVFAETKSVEEAFDNLSGKPGDKPSRATFLSIDYLSDGNTTVVAKSKMLPDVVPLEEIPDGFVLGQGPIKFPEEEK